MQTKKQSHNSQKAPNIKVLSKKTFQSAGKWIEKPRISEILICVCGNKYIKTRKNQMACIRCVYKTA